MSHGTAFLETLQTIRISYQKASLANIRKNNETISKRVPFHFPKQLLLSLIAFACLTAVGQAEVCEFYVVSQSGLPLDVYMYPEGSTPQKPIGVSNTKLTFEFQESQGDTNYIVLAKQQNPESNFLDEHMIVTPFQLQKTPQWSVPSRPRYVSLELDVWPPDSKIFITKNTQASEHLRSYLGVANQNQGLVIDRKSSYEGVGEEVALDIILEHKNFQPQTISVTPQMLDEAGSRFTNDPALVLTPVAGLTGTLANIKSWLRFKTWQPIVLLSLIIVSSWYLIRVALPGWQDAKKNRAREQFLQKYRDQIEPEDPFALKVFDRYRLLEKIGVGGMALVYHAVYDDLLEDSDDFAFKLMSLELADNEEYRLRFMREVEICRELNHPNIVRIIDWGESETVLYLVMELVEGDSLDIMLEENKLPLERFIGIFRSICVGLSYAHSKGVIHRDLKPANIMVHKDRVVKIMDLGLARLANNDIRLTRTGRALGTPAYMSPEQITGGILTGRADQYALGVMSYELLTGILPFEELDDPMQILMAHVQEDIPPISEFSDEIPENLVKILHKMVARDPMERYDSLSQVVEEIDRLGLN